MTRINSFAGQPGVLQPRAVHHHEHPPTVAMITVSDVYQKLRAQLGRVIPTGKRRAAASGGRVVQVTSAPDAPVEAQVVSTNGAGEAVNLRVDEPHAPEDERGITVIRKNLELVGTVMCEALSKALESQDMVQSIEPSITVRLEQMSDDERAKHDDRLMLERNNAAQRLGFGSYAAMEAYVCDHFALPITRDQYAKNPDETGYSREKANEMISEMVRSAISRKEPLATTIQTTLQSMKIPVE